MLSVVGGKYLLIVSVIIYFHMYQVCLSYNVILNLYSLFQYVYKVRVSVKGFDAPELIPRMAALSDVLVHELITGCKAMSGLGCGEICMAMGFDIVLNHCHIIVLLSVL